MKVENWPTERPQPHPNNPRSISPAAVDKVAASITEFGFQQPIVVDTGGVVVVGHTRLAAAIKLGLEEVPVVVANDLTETQARAYRLADNRTNEESAWDMRLLSVEMGELVDLMPDPSVIGFDIPEIDKILGGARFGADPDDTPDVPDTPTTQTGDIWTLGTHRLLCGDATDEAQVAAVLEGAVPLIMSTDPPYGVNYDPAWREDYDLNIGKKIGGKYSGRSTGRVKHDDRADWRDAWTLFSGSIAYVWHGGIHSAEVAEGIAASGLTLRAQIIWVKQHFVFGRGDYHWQHEPCWYAVRGTGQWTGGRKQTTVWMINNNNPFGTGAKTEEKTGHGTQKPVECMRRPIANHGGPDDAVYDPFVGSGTTIIAAEMEGRACYAIDIDEKYVDVSVLRWEAFTNNEATLAGDGRTFAEIREERADAPGDS